MRYSVPKSSPSCSGEISVIKREQQDDDPPRIIEVRVEQGVQTIRIELN